jgi:hypothetical protein
MEEIMAKATKMVRLAVDETSGVDHPAHLSEGWLVMKSANAEEIESVINSLTNTDSVADSTGLPTTIIKEDSVSEQTEVVVEDAVTPEVTDAPVATEAVVEETSETIDAKIAELEEELAKAKAKKNTDPAKSPDETDAEYMARLRDMKKSAPEAVVKMLDVLEKAASVEKARADEAVATLQKERDAYADAEAVAKAKNWNNLPLEAEKVGPALRRLAMIDEGLAKSIEGILIAVNEQAKTSNLFAEIGKSVDSSATDAYDRLYALAKAAVDSGVAPSFEVAMADAALANTDLYKQYLTEKGAK